MANNSWPTGHRHVHHGQRAESTERKIGLLWRDHHTEDPHTVDGAYAARDEARTRLDILEHPTAAKRLDRNRKLQRARAILRLHNRKANWLAAKLHEPLHYDHHVRLHENDPDNYDHPGTEGFELRDEDAARIGPTNEHVDIECDARIDDLRPRISELMALHTANKFTYPGTTDRVFTLIGQHAAAVERERWRAAFLKTLNTIAEDYFEPHHWTTAKSDELLAHVRAAQLGAPAENDVWHALAASGMSANSEHDDLLAVCAAVAHARLFVPSYPIWTDAPNTLPDLNVTVSSHQITVAWSGSLPANIFVRGFIVQSARLRTDAPFEFQAETSPKTLNFAGDRVAVLVQFERGALAPGGRARTVGEIGYVGAL